MKTTLFYTLSSLSFSLSLVASETSNVKLGGYEIDLREDTSNFFDPVVDTLASLLKSEKADFRDLGIELSKKYVKEQLKKVDFEALTQESITYAINKAVDEAVELRHKGNDSYWCSWVTKPAEKKAAKLALQAAWGTKGAALQYGKDAVAVVTKPENMTALKEKLLAAYNNAEEGQARAKVLEAFKTHIADVVVDARYANNADTMAAWVFAPAEKLAIQVVVTRILSKVTRGALN